MFGLFSAFTSGLRPQALTFDFGGLQLRVPRRDDFAAWATLRGQSRGFLQPWEPRWPEDDLTHAAFNRRVSRYYSEIRQDQGYPFFLIERASGVILGGLNLSHVRRRAAQSVTLGYWMGAPYAGKGFMSAAVRALLGFAFDSLGKGEGSENAPRVPAARVLSSGFVRKPNLASSNVVVMSSSQPMPAPVQALQIRAEAQGALALADAPVQTTQVCLPGGLIVKKW